MIIVVLLTTTIALFVLNRTWTQPERRKDLAAIIQSVVTVVAIVERGIFAYYKLQIFRVFEPHLSISHEFSHR